MILTSKKLKGSNKILWSYKELFNGLALNTVLAPEDRNLKEQSSKVQMPRGFGEERMFKLHIDWHIQILMIIKQAKVM